MKSTAIERRALIALAIILVAAVAGIAAWRSSPPSDRQAPLPVAPAAIEAIDRAARADSIASARKKISSPREKNQRNKKTKSGGRNTDTKRRSLLDEHPDR